MRDLDTIIVTWNVSSLLIKNLQSIFNFTKNLDYKVIVVDNNSSDNTVFLLKENFKNEINRGLLEVLDTKKNNGFSLGNNIGIKKSDSKYILFMNPDMEITENTFYKMFNFMEDKEKDIVLSTTKLKYKEGDIQHNVKGLPTPIINICVLLKLHHLFSKTKLFKKYFLSDFDYSKESKVDQIMGAFIFARSNFIKNIGGWNLDYFLWWEDVDLCKKVYDLGKKIIYTPTSEVIHYEGRSFNQVESIKKQKRFNKGMKIYSKKYFSKIPYFFIYIFSFISIFLSFLVKIFKIKPRGQGKI
ncbi:glycosyltransferase family 2 protein [Patescibacteria group bacterium]|nr:glycosyltransferase family 2 protein [Patescibacteria group bacterium]